MDKKTKTDSKRYFEAMARGDTDACIDIEKKHSLFGLPPEVVTDSLLKIERGEEPEHVGLLYF